MMAERVPCLCLRFHPFTLVLCSGGAAGWDGPRAVTSPGLTYRCAVPGTPISSQPAAGLASWGQTFVFLLSDGCWFRTTPRDLFAADSVIKLSGPPSHSVPRKVIVREKRGACQLGSGALGEVGAWLHPPPGAPAPALPLPAGKRGTSPSSVGPRPSQG